MTGLQKSRVWVAEHRPLRVLLPRMVATEGRRLLGSSDKRRWSKDQSYSAEWGERFRLMTADVQPGQRVLDFGAGSSPAAQLLPASCVHVGIDLVKRLPDTVVCDLNRDPVPDLLGDWVILSGVLEYLHDVHGVLAQIVRCAPRVVLSYETWDVTRARSERRMYGWVNDMTPDELDQLVAAVGLREVRRLAWRRQTVLFLERAAG